MSRTYHPPEDWHPNWAAVTLTAGGVRTSHVLPVDDAWPHEESADCPCDPTATPLPSGGTVYSHHSFDGREAVEWAKDILNGSAA